MPTPSSIGGPFRSHSGSAGLRRFGAVLGTALALAWLGTPSPSHAQEHGTLVRMLHDGHNFRVRVQAAFALGNTRESSVREHLERALAEDSNPAVRAAAATALGRLGSEKAVKALRAARRDESASVRMQAKRSIDALTESEEPASSGGEERSSSRDDGSGSSRGPRYDVAPSEGTINWPRISYVVRVGKMSNESDYAGEELAKQLEAHVVRQLRALRGVAVFDGEGELDRRARRQIRKRDIPQLRFEGNLVKVKRDPRGRELSVRCEVSLMLLEHEGGNIRVMLEGAATGSGRRRRNWREQARGLAEDALEGAVRSAMSTAPRALSQAARR